MTQEQLLQAESSQRQHFQDLEHQSKMNVLVEQEEYNLFATLKPKFYQDKSSNQWVVLLGDKIENGVYGYGETLYKAILNFNKSFHKK